MKTPQKLLKISKDLGHQYVDFVQLFEKKIKPPAINTHSRLELLQQYRNYQLTGSEHLTHTPEAIYQCDQFTVYGAFENSNIHAVSHEDGDINILLSADSNSQGCTQWFYFGIKSNEQQTLRIRILNNRRSKSLLPQYNHIHVFDNGHWQAEKVQNVFYYRTNINHPFYHHSDSQIAQHQTNISLYTLEFTYEFNQSDQIVYFSLALPYTLKRLYKFLSTTTLKKKSICQTQLGLPVYQLKTMNKSQEVVVILARQHPSEAVGSWLCQEIIRHLQSHPITQKYRFIIYPMINPDGVFLGNSRCNFNGVDLNRKWETPNQSIEPEVYYIQKSLKKYQIAFLIDLHGHSKKLNSFMYGCSSPFQHVSEYMQAKQFSRILAQNNELFSYKDCTFTVSPDRKATARVAMWRKLKIPNAMTIETSLYGYTGGVKDKPYTVADFSKMAISILNGLLRYDSTTKDPHLFEANEIHRVMHLIKKNAYEEKESESDSEAEDDIIIPRHPRLKLVSRRDSTPSNIKIHHPVKANSKLKQQSETPQLAHQTSLFFKQSDNSYSFKKIPTNNSKRMQVQQMQKIRSRMNSFQSQYIEEVQQQLPQIHYAKPGKNIKGALDLIQAIQVKSLFK